MNYFNKTILRTIDYKKIYQNRNSGSLGYISFFSLAYFFYIFFHQTADLKTFFSLKVPIHGRGHLHHFSYSKWLIFSVVLPFIFRHYPHYGQPCRAVRRRTHHVRRRGTAAGSSPSPFAPVLALGWTSSQHMPSIGRGLCRSGSGVCHFPRGPQHPAPVPCCLCRFCSPEGDERHDAGAPTLALSAARTEPAHLTAWGRAAAGQENSPEI